MNYFCWIIFSSKKKVLIRVWGKKRAFFAHFRVFFKLGHFFSNLCVLSPTFSFLSETQISDYQQVHETWLQYFRAQLYENTVFWDIDDNSSVFWPSGHVHFRAVDESFFPPLMGSSSRVTTGSGSPKDLGNSFRNLQASIRFGILVLGSCCSSVVQ